MKKMKKIFALLIAMVMVLGMSTMAFAQDIDSGKGGSGEITIQNASKGIHYTVTKIFDATYNTTTGTIAYTYTGTLTTNDYFAQNASTGAITVKDAAKDESGNLTQEAANWLINNVTGTVVINAQEATDGDSLVIKNLEYGYYLISSDLGTGTVLSVDSTAPKATMYDKNTNTPHFDDEQGKKVDDANVKIGQTVTYTIDFTATNYTGSGADAKKVASYKIEDTLPDYLGDVKVTSITVADGADHDAEAEGVQPADVTAQFSNKAITIAWVDEEGNSLYNNNAVITITYTAKVTKDAAIAGEGNKNTVNIIPQDTDGEELPGKITDDEVIKTYALAIKKVDNKGNALPGATFKFPFAVAAEKDENGYYVVDASAATQEASIETPADGIIVIKGVEAGTYSIEETAAPQGYNELGAPVSVTATEVSTKTTSVTKYIDASGNVVDTETDVKVEYENADLSADVVFVVNQQGAELPSTGGIGTTIFYIIGAILVIGAGVVLVTRRRMNANK